MCYLKNAARRDIVSSYYAGFMVMSDVLRQQAQVMSQNSGPKLLIPAISEMCVKKERSLHIGVHVETSLAAGRDILAGVGRYVSEHGNLSLCVYPHHIDAPPPTWFSQRKFDGIIARLHNPQVAEAVARLGVPVVDVLGVYNPGLYPLVHTDNAAIGEMAARHFLQRGFGSYGFFGLDDQFWSVERRDAYAAALAGRGQSCSLLTWSNEYEDKAGLEEKNERVAEWLKTLRLPAAIFVSQDIRALMLRDVAASAGFAAGRDLAILGVGDDRTFCEIPSPTLSSIDADHRGVGYHAAALLEQMIHGQEPITRQILIKPRGIVVRESTDFLAIPDENLRLAIKFIRGNAVKGISVDSVAEAVLISRSVLQRRFREVLGMTVHDFILQEKARRAIRMIQETDASIGAIAESSGFMYVQTLNKALRRLYGQSASNYRKEKKNGDVTFVNGDGI